MCGTATDGSPSLFVNTDGPGADCADSESGPAMRQGESIVVWSTQLLLTIFASDSLLLQTVRLLLTTPTKAYVLLDWQHRGILVTSAHGRQLSRHSSFIDAYNLHSNLFKPPRLHRRSQVPILPAPPLYYRKEASPSSSQFSAFSSDAQKHFQLKLSSAP